VRLRLPSVFLCSSGSALLLIGACSDWGGLYGSYCDGEWIGEDDDCASASICGDRNVSSQEECDDGNTDNGDGCSSLCEVESAAGGGAGLGGRTGEPLACGNGTLDDGEICDDGNLESDDACLGGCSWASCGDGVVRKGVEECDDGNRVSGDECARSCLKRIPGDFFILGEDHTYTYYEEPASYADAYETCALGGGYLWVPSVAGELRTVERNMAPDQQEVWLGLELVGAEHQWVNGSSGAYRPWIAGEPGAETCVVQFAVGADLENFRTRACDELRPFICEHQEAHIHSTTHHGYRRWFLDLTFEESVAFCSKEGGELAAFETDAEREYLSSAFPAPFWINATRRDEGGFEWHPSGLAVDSTNFGDEVTSELDLDCVYNRSGTLIPSSCEDERMLVCEFH